VPFCPRLRGTCLTRGGVFLPFAHEGERIKEVLHFHTLRGTQKDLWWGIKNMFCASVRGASPPETGRGKGGSGKTIPQ